MERLLVCSDPQALAQTHGPALGSAAYPELGLADSADRFGRAVSFIRSTSTGVSFSTTFQLTENPISESSKWTNGLTNGLDWTDVQTGLGDDATTHIAFGTRGVGNPPPFNDSIAHLSGFGSNQSAQGTIYNGASANEQEVELLLRWSITANVSRGYEIDILRDGRVAIVRWNGALNDFTTLSAASGSNNVATGAVWYADIVGTLITVKVDSVVVKTYDTSGDATKWSDGNPGIGFYRDSTLGAPGANNTFGLKFYSANTL